MSEPTTPGKVTRRSLLLGGAGAATIVALSHGRSNARPATTAATSAVSPESLTGTELVSSLNAVPDVHLAATDGWVNIARPGAAGDAWMKDLAPFWPDQYAAAHNGGNLYVFGFRNVTGFTDAEVTAVRGKAQISAPQLVFDQIDSNAPRDQGYRVQLTNMGLSQRPDLVDGHTIHWHGFVNEIPLFDGVPELSLSVPIGRSFTYFYRPYDPGTYMYHCHYEDVEHVQMGMTGLLFVRPLQNGKQLGSYDWTKSQTRYVFNDEDGSTQYDREFGMILTEIFAEGHYRDAHIQTTDWTDFKASFWCLNGRTYPDTTAPNAPYDTAAHGGLSRGYDPATGAATSADGASLLYQPQSSLVTANAGERVLLRLASLGYQNHAMTVDSIDLTIVGKDASQLKNGNVNQYIVTNTVDIGPGESRDVIFSAPAFSGGSGTSGQGYDTYLLYDRDYAYASNGGQPGAPGGMQTEIRVYPAGTLAVQATPNEQSAKA